MDIKSTCPSGHPSGVKRNTKAIHIQIWNYFLSIIYNVPVKSEVKELLPQHSLWWMDLNAAGDTNTLRCSSIATPVNSIWKSLWSVLRNSLQFPVFLYQNCRCRHETSNSNNVYKVRFFYKKRSKPQKTSLAEVTVFVALKINGQS